MSPVFGTSTVGTAGVDTFTYGVAGFGISTLKSAAVAGELASPAPKSATPNIVFRVIVFLLIVVNTVCTILYQILVGTAHPQLQQLGH